MKVKYHQHAEFVERHFSVQGHSGSEYSVLCPVHGDTHASMRINVDKGVFFCHGCGEKGSIKKLARLIGVGYTYDESESLMATLQSKLELLRQGKKQNKPRVLPESFLDRYKFDATYWTDPLPNGRGLAKETVEAFDLGYDPINECVTIPVRDVDGALLGVTRRFLDPDADCKYKDPRGFPKAENLFASWFAANSPSPTVVLTEGLIDAIKVWQAGHVGLGVYMSYLTEHQIMLLRRMSVVTVILFFDNDKAGRKARKQALGFTWDRDAKKWMYSPATDLRRFFIVKQVNYRNLRGKDPGSLSDTEVDQAICASRIVM